MNRFSVTKRSDVSEADFLIVVDSVRYAYNEINTGGAGGEHGSERPTGSFTINQGSHISGLTKFHDISMIFPGFVKKIPSIFPIIFRPQITFG